jgi:hypothetical protein
MKCYRDKDRECTNECMAFTEGKVHGTNCSKLANDYAMATNAKYLADQVAFLGSVMSQAMTLAMQAIPGAGR